MHRNFASSKALKYPSCHSIQTKQAPLKGWSYLHFVDEETEAQNRTGAPPGFLLFGAGPGQSLTRLEETTSLLQWLEGGSDVNGSENLVKHFF